MLLKKRTEHKYDQILLLQKNHDDKTMTKKYNKRVEQGNTDFGNRHYENCIH